MRLFAFALVLAALPVSAVAHAQSDHPEKPGEGFGKRGKFLVAVDNVFGIAFEKLEDRDDATRHTGAFPGIFGPRIGLHGAFESGVTLGANLGLSNFRVSSGTNDDSDGLWALQIIPRIGYAGSFSPGFGFWLRAGPSFRFLVPEEGRGDANYIGLGGEAFLVATPVEHFGVMFGPTCDIGLVGENDNKFNSLGASVGLVADL